MPLCCLPTLKPLLGGPQANPTDPCMKRRARECFLKERDELQRDLCFQTHVLKTCCGPDTGCPLGPDSARDQERQDPRRVHGTPGAHGDLEENSFQWG